MLLFGLALGVLELIALSVFFILLVVAVTFDRRGVEAPKWWVVGGAFAAIAAYFWSDWTLAGIWTAVTTAEFWTPVLYFVVAGLAYSVLEFVLTVRRSAREFKKLWENHLNHSSDRRTMYAEAAQKGAVSADFQKVADMTNSFVSNAQRRSDDIVQVERAEDKISVVPKINKTALAENIGAWTFFWPFYAISLILGDLLTEVFRAIADFFVKISGRFVRMSFADVFKF
jgi:hypothetical protein